MSLAVKVRDVSKQFGRHELTRLSSSWRPGAGAPALATAGGLGRRALPGQSLAKDAWIEQDRRKPKYAPPGVVQAVDHVTFSVSAGEICALVGPSGSGKSTLIRLLAAQLEPDNGVILVFGWDTARRPDQVRRLANRVAGDASFFPRLTALENLLAGEQRYGAAEIEARQKAIQMLTQLGLNPGEIHRPMERLSPADQQKVALARALLARPALLLLDEPGRNLDPVDRRYAFDAVQELRDRAGATVIVAARNEHQVREFCDRIIFI